MPRIRTSELSLRAVSSNKVGKSIIRDLGGSGLGQLPYCYMRPSAKLAVKLTN
jgi:hypothetical protein